MTGDLWEEAFECARRARKLRQLLQDGTGISGRESLEKQAEQLERQAAQLKARAAAASPGPQNSLIKKRHLISRKKPDPSVS